jgi:hypothetical protein
MGGGTPSKSVGTVMYSVAGFKASGTSRETASEGKKIANKLLTKQSRTSKNDT